MSAGWPANFGAFSASQPASFSKYKKRKYDTINLESKAEKSDNKKTSTWIDLYAPKSFDELAVHKKKVAEVESWISQTKFSRNAPILLLTGPSGCGKTATVRLAASWHGVEVCEWTNPLTVSFHITKEAGLPYQSLVTQFEEFLFRSGRYPALEFSDTLSTKEENSNKRRILLLEDLPDHIVREPTSFRDTLRRFSRYQRNALVIIISDRSVPDSTRRNLLPPDVLLGLGVKTMNFNPIAMTSMTKVLTRIASMEHQTVSKEQLSQVVAASSGDVRTAINSLQFLLQKGAPLPAQSRSKKSRPLKRQRSMDLIKSDAVPCIGGKDVSLLLFRALGKILYCKREKPGPNRRKLPLHLSHHYRDPMILEPEEILQHCCLSGSAYCLFLHHNCVPFFSDVESLSGAFEDFSLADVVSSRKSRNDFSSETSDALDAYDGCIAARSVAFWNTNRATVELCESSTGQWRPLHKPSWYEVAKKRAENRSASRALFWDSALSNDELLLTQLPLVGKILSARNDFDFAISSASRVSLDRGQRDFLSSVVRLPKWKSFASRESARIADVEMGDQDFEQDSGDVATSARDGDLVGGDHDEDLDEDYLIEDFSD